MYHNQTWHVVSACTVECLATKKITYMTLTRPPRSNNVRQCLGAGDIHEVRHCKGKRSLGSNKITLDYIIKKLALNSMVRIDMKTIL